MLNKSVQKAVKEIGRADILIGIPSYNNARTIGQVVRAVNAGLAKYFPQVRSVLVNSDGGSQDGTPEVVRNTQLEDLHTILVHHPLYPIHKIITPYHGIPGKGSAFKSIFKIAEALKVKACAVVDSDLRSITPEWIELLIGPIYNENFDYVAPLYSRHKYDGTITNSVVYPLTRALYGQRIRQPIGGDFGFSGELASSYLSKKVWDSEVARYGIDIWMTTTAITEGYRVCQSYLGAKIHNRKDPGKDLTSMLTQVLSSVFMLMEEYYLIWLGIKRSNPVPLFGFQYEVGVEPVQVDIERMTNTFQQGLRDLADFWKKTLSKESFEGLLSLAKLSSADFYLPLDLWVRIVYDFAVAFHKKIMSRELLLKSMIPLYLGWIASFVRETKDSSPSEVEERIESLCQRFENLKSYLIEKWR